METKMFADSSALFPAKLGVLVEKESFFLNNCVVSLALILLAQIR